MKNFSRVKQKFKRQGINVSYRNGVYHVENEKAQASILLPESFVLEEKAVAQLLAFASVGTPARPHAVLQIAWEMLRADLCRTHIHIFNMTNYYFGARLREIN